MSPGIHSGLLVASVPHAQAPDSSGQETASWLLGLHMDVQGSWGWWGYTSGTRDLGGDSAQVRLVPLSTEQGPP